MLIVKDLNCIPLKLRGEALTPNVSVFGDRAFKEVIVSKRSQTHINLGNELIWSNMYPTTQLESDL